MVALGILIVVLSLWKWFRLLVVDEGVFYVLGVVVGFYGARVWIVGALALLVFLLGLVLNALFEKI